MKRLILLFCCLMPITILAAARPAPLPESRLTGTLHGEGQIITNVANVVTSNGVSLVGLSTSKADSSALSTTSNALAQAVALKADAATAATTSALATTSNNLAQAVAIKANTTALTAASNALAQAIAAIPLGDPNAVEGRFTITSTAPLTLVVSNGLIYALDPNGTMVDVTYYLPVFAVNEPTTNYPAGFVAFDFAPNTTNVSASAPQIAEWTRTGDPGDVITISAEGLDDSSVFVFTDSTGDTRMGDIVALDGQLARVIIPSGLATNDVYMMHPFSFPYGFGEPVLINGVDSWWLGNSPAAATETFRVYGSSLAMEGDSAWVYIVGYGWLESTNANPFMAEFVVPALANGTYTVYPHSGHGGKYNFGDALSLVVDSSVLINWAAGTTRYVETYGGLGNGSTDNSSAITAMINASSAGDTLCFTGSVYVTSTRIQPKASTRILGAGMDNTKIIRSSGSTDNLMLRPLYNNNTYQDITFDVGSSATDGYVIYLNNSLNHRFIRVRIDERTAGTGYVAGCTLAGTTKGTVFDSCELFLQRVLTTDEFTTFIRCEFIGVFDANTLLGADADGIYNIALIDCFVHPENTSNPANGAGWSKGRWISGNGPRNIYVGGSITTNMCPRYDPAFDKYHQPVDQNSGEQVMFEGLYTRYRQTVSSPSASSVVLAGLGTNYAGRIISVVSGKGLGQSRIISAVNTGTGEVTITKPWRVIPDTNSVCSIGYYGTQVAVYGNSFHGDARTSDPTGITNPGPSYTNYTATTAVSLYGGFSGAVVKDNLINSVNSGLNTWALAKNLNTTGTSPFAWQPNMFNTFDDNEITNCLYGIRSDARIFDTGTASYEDNILFANVWRDIDLKGITGSGVVLFSDVYTNPGYRANTFQRFTYDNVATNVSVDGLSYDNLFISSSNSVVSYDGSGTNFFDVFEVPPQLQIPQGTVPLDNASETISIYNVGTTGLTWTATDNATWLGVTASGSISAESSGDMVLSRSGSTTNGATALVSVVAAGQTNVFTVIYGDELGVE